jgi:hypothetical protein
MLFPFLLSRHGGKGFSYGFCAGKLDNENNMRPGPKNTCTKPVLCSCLMSLSSTRKSRFTALAINFWRPLLSVFDSLHRRILFLTRSVALLFLLPFLLAVFLGFLLQQIIFRDCEYMTYRIVESLKFRLAWNARRWQWLHSRSIPLPLIPFWDAVTVASARCYLGIYRITEKCLGFRNFAPIMGVGTPAKIL